MLLFQVALDVDVVSVSETTTDIPQRVCPATGAPGVNVHPFAVDGAVKVPVDQV